MSENNIESVNMEEKIVSKKSKKTIPEVIDIKIVDTIEAPVPVANTEKEASIVMFGLIKNSAPSQRSQKIDSALAGKSFIFKK